MRRTLKIGVIVVSACGVAREEKRFEPVDSGASGGDGGSLTFVDDSGAGRGGTIGYGAGGSSGATASSGSAGAVTGGTAGSAVRDGGSSNGCCQTEADCKSDIIVNHAWVCAQGVCKPRSFGRCWIQAECRSGTCTAVVCPCGARCSEPDEDGICADPK